MKPIINKEYSKWRKYTYTEFEKILDKLREKQKGIDITFTVFAYEDNFMIEEYWGEDMSIEEIRQTKYFAYNESIIMYTDGKFNYESYQRKMKETFESFKKRHRFYSEGDINEYINEINNLWKYINQEFIPGKKELLKDKKNVNFKFEITLGMKKIEDAEHKK